MMMDTESRLKNLLADRMLRSGEIISDREQSNAYVGVRIAEVMKFGRCWQITFVDGEACEIKQVLPNNRVMTVCYGEERVWPERRRAINFFTMASEGCDPDSSECGRYEKILAELYLGKNICTDEED